jgi:hypothetical protein
VAPVVASIDADRRAGDVVASQMETTWSRARRAAEIRTDDLQ